MAFRPEPFGKYFLVDKIAVGGMAEIFKAKQFGPGGFEKVLVIKKILAHLSEDHDFIQMFQDEAKICSTLSHSNIIHLYEFGKVKTNYFIAMEYCEGKDLKTVMKKCQEIGRPLPVEYAVYIIHEVCKGLDYAHRKKDMNNHDMNILHRDISPSNVIISYDEGKVKIADFGIAKAQNTRYQTKAGVLKGKFEYMSPEQASGLQIDRRSDLFSVGICFYEIVTRRRLFKTDSDMKTLELIRNPLIPPPSHLNPQVSEELDAIIMKALARKPEERYQEAWQLQHDLREYMRASTPPTSPDLIGLSLANFMREIFDREIRQDRERLELGTRLTREMMAQREVQGLREGEEEESWEIPSGNSRVTTPPQPTGTTEVRLMIEEQKKASSNRSLLVIAGMAAVVVTAGLVFYGAGPGADSGSSPDADGARVVESRAKARLELTSTPENAQIFVNGLLIGVTPLVYEDLKAEVESRLRVELPGYEAHTRTLNPRAGERMVISIELKPKSVATAPVPVPTAAPRLPSTPRPGSPAPVAAPANTGRFEFLSVPAGASVQVDGRPFCTTPCAMENGRADATYSIEFTLDGHQPYRTRARMPASGSSRVNATLTRAEVGFLTVSIKDGLSAEISVDGQSKGYGPGLERVVLPAGRHTIRLRNQVAGLEKTVSVEVAPGQEARLLGIDLKE